MLQSFVWSSVFPAKFFLDFRRCQTCVFSSYTVHAEFPVRAFAIGVALDIPYDVLVEIVEYDYSI